MTDQTENTQKQTADNAAEQPAANTETPIDDLLVRLQAEKQARAAAEAEILKREAAIAQLNSKAGEANKSLENAVGAYKSLLISANPAIPSEMISGNSIKEIDSSLESARGLVSKVRLAVEAEITAGKIPAGAPPRPSPNAEGMSAREKIQYGLSKGSGR